MDKIQEEQIKCNLLCLLSDKKTIKERFNLIKLGFFQLHDFATFRLLIQLTKKLIQQKFPQLERIYLYVRLPD